MSKSHIPIAIRRRVIRRADGICEYCLLPEAFCELRFQIDHVIAEKHLGRTIIANLAHVCIYCNLAKGSDIGSIHWPSGEFVRLFNPRTDRWSTRFRLWKSRIEGLTPIGVVTVHLLEFNRSKRLKERSMLIKAGLYPDAAGKKRMSIDPL